MPNQEKEKTFLQQADFERHIVENLGAETWFVAHQSEQNERTSIILFSAMIPNHEVERAMKSTDWDLHTHDTMPVWWSSLREGETERYSRLSSDRGVEPIVICRNFHGLKPSYREVSEEFRLYHNLYHDAPNKRYVAHDDGGNEEDIIRYDDWLIKIKTHALLRYSADKQCHLAVFFESIRYSEFSLADLSLKRDQRRSQSGLMLYDFSLNDTEMMLDEKKKSMSCFYGKKLIPPPSLKNKERVAKEPYQEFIIGQKSDGSPVLHTSDPEQLANYFGKNPTAPHYLTPVHFRPEALQKYFGDPEKYSVEDGYLRCGSLWGLRLDNNHKGYLTVFLGDLGRDLTNAERDYWKSFNIPPEGPGISEVNWKRGFMAEFADPTQPSLRFKELFSYFQREHREQQSWTLFKDLADEDRHFFDALRTPLTRGPAEFDSQVLALTKVIVDSINEEEIEKRITNLAEGDKGIVKLEKFLQSKNLVGYEAHVQFLKNLQKLRSTGVAHRKGENFKKVAALFELDKNDRIKVFENILLKSAEFMEFLIAGFLIKA